jgi:hypothetical protein
VTTLLPKDDSFSISVRPNGPRSVLTAQSERVERFLKNIPGSVHIPVEFTKTNCVENQNEIF